MMFICAIRSFKDVSASSKFYISYSDSMIDFDSAAFETELIVF